MITACDISVVIPVYGVERWVEACLRSVLVQRGVSVECIVVDDCSVDSSMEVVAQVLGCFLPGPISDSSLPSLSSSLFSSSEVCSVDVTDNVTVKCVRMEQNSGLSAARNRGVACATGKYVFFLDSDDKLVDDGVLARMFAAAFSARVSAFPSSSSSSSSEIWVDWVQGNFLRVPFSEDGSSSSSASWSSSYHDSACQFLSRDKIVERFAKLNFTNATNKLIRLGFIRQFELEFCPGLIYEDSLWCMQAYCHVQSIATLEGDTYYHNIRDNSIMRSDYSQRKADSMLYIVEQLQQLRDCKSESVLCRDLNLEHTVAFDTLFLVKSLWMSSLPRVYARGVLCSLEGAGVFDCKVNRGVLPWFTRVLSGCFSMPTSWLRLWWIEVVVWMYKKYKGWK